MEIMETPVVKFNKEDRPDFYRVLRKRVNAHFTDNNISRHANYQMIFKTGCMLALYFTPLLLMITGQITEMWSMIACWIGMGLGMSGIGLAIMHDANHGAYSINPKINRIIGYILNFTGGYHNNWKIQHNVLHHSYTNIHGHDEDIEKGIIRFSPTQKRRPIYVIQVLYAPLLYGIMTLYWLVGKDFQQVIRYRKKNLLASQGLTFAQAMTHILINKTLYVILTVALPIMVLPFAWWQTMLGFLLMHFICGLILALIFQPAHVIEETDFFMPSETGSVENSWAIHQMRTTSNFANGSTFFSWCIGGLNYQIEHHLFPNICHVHYKALAPIVKQTAKEFGIPYYHHKTFFHAVKSHFSLLHALGTGSYDKRVLKNIVSVINISNLCLIKNTNLFLVYSMTLSSTMLRLEKR